MNLLDLYEQREPYQQNIDELEYRRISDLRDKMEYLMKAYRQATTDDAKNAIMARYNQYKAEREGYAKVREQQVPGRQDTVAHGKPDPRGIGDVQDPRDKMAQLAQKAKKGPLANVGAGIKAFVKGEPEPMDEQQLNPRALGNANFARLVKANMDGNLPVGLEFIRPEENFQLDQRGLDLISDYYDGLQGDPAKNYFIYRVLPSGEETLKVLRQLGYTPALALKQQSLPGIPTQGELPLQEKKKSDDLEAGDVNVARELQKLRARYPATRSDIEAVAKAEIDSTERSQQQLAAIRGANEKQDALLKQLVDLDKQQGREIDGLDKENNSLEQRLASIQTMNTGLQKAIGTMGANRPTAKVTATKPAKGYADLAQGGIIDTGPDVTPVGTGSQPETRPQSKPTADVVGSMVQQLRAKPAPQSMRGDAANQPIKAPEPQVAEGNIKQLDTLRRELEHYGAKRFGQIYGMTTDQINRIKNPNVAQDMPMSAPRFRDSQDRAQLEAQANQSTNDLADNYDDYEDEDEDLRLRSGDYVRDTMDGESGEVFRMQGDPEERRVRILDRDGRGWYIEPGRLVVVDRNDPDVQRYFGKRRVRDMDEQSVAETALNPKDPKGDYAAKRKALQDLSMNKDVDQKAVQQRKLDLEKEAKAKGIAEEVNKAGALKAAQAAAKFMIRNLDDRAALKDYSMHFWSPTKFYQGATMAMRGVGYDEIVQHITQDRPAQFEQEQKPGFGEFPPKQEITIVPPKKLKSGETYQDRNKYWQSQGQAPIYKTNEDNDQVKRVFKDTAGKPVGEIGIDPESSPGNGEWYVHHYATGYSVVGFDSAAEAKRELMYVNKHPDAVEGHPSTKEQGVAESAKPGEYYIHTVYFKDGTKKRIRVTSDEVDVADYYTKRGQAVDRVDYDFQLHSDTTEGLKSTLAGAALAGAMALGGAGAAQAQSASGGPNLANPTTIIQQIQSGKIQNQNDLASALGNASNKQAVFKILQNKAGLPGHGADSVINALGKKGTAGAQQPAKSVGQSGSIIQRPTDNFEGHPSTVDKLGVAEAEKEPTTRQELLNRVDKIQRMMSQERNPANLQILRKELEMLKQRYQHLKEDNDSEAVERAILNRIMVAHTDLLMKFGPDKVMQAAEEVAYNVGDVDEIGTSDVSAYVAQVKQILGAVNETQVNEKWSAKYKSSIDCADPKGFSQKAHCAGRKK
jgi:hypothetical protein